MRQGSINGKGAVFQVSDAKWVAKVCLGVDDNGKPIIKQFSGKTEAIAKKKLRDFKKSTDYTEKHIPSTDSIAYRFGFFKTFFGAPHSKTIVFAMQKIKTVYIANSHVIKKHHSNGRKNERKSKKGKEK